MERCWHLPRRRRYHRTERSDADTRSEHAARLQDPRCVGCRQFGRLGSRWLPFPDLAQFGNPALDARLRAFDWLFAIHPGGLVRAGVSSPASKNVVECFLPFEFQPLPTCHPPSTLPPAHTPCTCVVGPEGAFGCV